MNSHTPTPELEWLDASGSPQRSQWRGSMPAPKRLRAVDDGLPADTAMRWASEGMGLVWQGDYHQAHQLLQALDRRVAKQQARTPLPAGLTERFHLGRKQQAERRRLLGRLLLPFEAGHQLLLRRAPDPAPAAAALGPAGLPYLLPLRDWLGMLGAYEWWRQGLAVPQLGGARLHIGHGVFAPTRHEYLDLVLEAPLPGVPGVVDVGTGSGVLALLLARRGAGPLWATDTEPRALDCAQAHAKQLGVAIRFEQAALFGHAPAAGLLVCNPPWLPGKVGSALDAAVYDEDSRMLRGFLAGTSAHLAPGGEAWLILSDLAERLGLRAPGQLLGWIEASGLKVVGRLDTAPRHGRALRADDPLHAARRSECVSLWRLQPA